MTTKDGPGAKRKKKRLSAHQRRLRLWKLEVAEELNLLDKVRRVGWAGLSAAETGRIGGLMNRKINAFRRRKRRAVGSGLE